MGWLAFIGVWFGVAVAIFMLTWAGYRIGRDSRIHEIEDKADDRVYAMREKYTQAIAKLQSEHKHSVKEDILGELEAYRFRIQREVRDAIQRVALTVEDAVGSGCGVMSNGINEFGKAEQ